MDHRSSTLPRPALLCFCQLRWGFVWQRPQHLMSRLAQRYRVFFVEEAAHETEGETYLARFDQPGGVTVLVPHLPVGMAASESEDAQRRLLSEFWRSEAIGEVIGWFYTPMALGFADHLRFSGVVYDCMDELSGFRFAPPQLKDREAELLRRADVVFTGGYSLYEAKRRLHANVHALPSSVDVPHFARAREGLADPADQAGLPRPRLGYCGVIDERLDLDLLAGLADGRPDCQIVMVGPVVKIEPSALPQRPNITYVGRKDYAELPEYLANWDVALMPFAQNEATRFISPTKTPEYLAAGRPVVSTPIVDVVRDYSNLVEIAPDVAGFVSAVDRCLGHRNDPEWLARVDGKLASMSWDNAAATVQAKLNDALAARRAEPAKPTSEIVPLAGRATRAPARRSGFDYLIVGAGFAGSVIAERLASQSGKRVLLMDRRSHIGGNAYDCYDEAGLLIHRYGPHIFHTNSAAVAEYLSQFTQWRPYEHRVLAHVDSKLVPIPINLTTLNRLYGLDLSPAEAERFLAARAETLAEIKTSEDVVVSQIGRELYEKFFRGYTRKQWGLDPSELDKSVTARIPTRTNIDDRYFLDSFQAMPKSGYTRMFENMLDHPNIKILLNADYREIKDEIAAQEVIYTGPVDEFFDYRFGALPYRSLKFKHETLDVENFQSVAVVNHPGADVPFTRITEYKHLTGQAHPKTSVSYEFPTSEGDPYYPVPRPENAQLYKQYQALADATAGVHFIGRLATYKYYNMDQVVGQALALYARLSGESRRSAAVG